MVLNRGLNEGAVKCERVYDTQLLFSHSSKSTQWDGLAMLARPASKNTASFLAKENLVRVVKISKKSNFQHCERSEQHLNWSKMSIWRVFGKIVALGQAVLPDSHNT